jgi:hypothetical protein
MVSRIGLEALCLPGYEQRSLGRPACNLVTVWIELCRFVYYDNQNSVRSTDYRICKY